MEAVCILLGEKTDFDTAQKILGQSDFLEKLKNYDKDNIPQPVLKKLAKYIARDDFTPDSCAKQSLACKTLCMWTHAMDTYSKVAKEVEPKKKKLAAMNEELATAEGTLAEKRAALQVVLDKVAALQKQLEDTENEKNRLIKEAEVTKALRHILQPDGRE